MLVKKWMSASVHKLDPETSVKEAHDLFQVHGLEVVPVYSEGKLAGILSRQQLEIHQEKTTGVVQDIMQVTDQTIDLYDPLEKAAGLMTDLQLDALVVVEEESLVGILTYRDILRALSEMTGARWGLTRLTLVTDETPQKIGLLLQILRKYQIHLVSLFATHYQMPPGKMEFIIRLDGDRLDDVISEIEVHFGPVIIHRGES